MRRATRRLLLVALLTPLGFSIVVAQTPPPAPPAAKPSGPVYPTKDRFGRPLPELTFYCQYAGLARDCSGKYPVYQSAMFKMASHQGAVQNAWRDYIEATYHPGSPGNPMGAVLPDDPARREAALKSFNPLTQPATQVVVTTSWKP